LGKNCVLSWLLEFTSVCPMWRTMARKVSNCFLFYVRNSISPAWGG
jgi:iron only hydrogenase large subunit-like protein